MFTTLLQDKVKQAGEVQCSKMYFLFSVKRRSSRSLDFYSLLKPEHSYFQTRCICMMS